MIKWQEEYRKTHPWTRHYYFSKTRAKRKNIIHKMNVFDFKELWFRDKAWLLKEPSIDRLINSKGYIKSNCRFIEKRLNTSLGNMGNQNAKGHGGRNHKKFKEKRRDLCAR